MEWREVAFSSTPNSFHAFSLPQTSTLDVSDKSNSSNLRACLIGATGVCRIINYKSSSTKVFWLRAVIKTINLVEIMKIQIDATKFFEVSDAKLYRDGDETLLCVSWVQQDVNCSVLEQFVTLFRVIDEGIVFVEKFSLDKPWASTMIIPSANHSLLVLFPLRAEPMFFKVSSEKLDRFDASSDPNFVSLASNVNKDLILRSSRHVDRDFVWNAVGSDAGILTISLHNSSTETLIGSRSFKFSGIISIVEFLGASRDEKLSPKYSEVLLLVSSSVGPTMIWQCCVSETGELSIGKDGCGLHESTGKDVITSALVVKNWIFVGTYAGIFLVYQRPKFFDLLPEVLDTAYSVDISSPIISLCPLSDEGHMIGVLTTEGFHVIHYQERVSMTSGPYNAPVEDEIEPSDERAKLTEDPVLPIEPKFTLGPETTVPNSPNNLPITSPPKETRLNSNSRNRRDLPSGGRPRPDSLAIDRARL